jgi:hypothetical protein
MEKIAQLPKGNPIQPTTQTVAPPLGFCVKKDQASG